MILAIGPIQLILILLVPAAIFFLGYMIGKKSGYIKRTREIENQDK